MPVTPYMTVMAAIRRIKGISQYRLEDATGICQTMISQIENRRMNPKIEELEKIAVCLDYHLPVATLLQTVEEWEKTYGQLSSKTIVIPSEVIIYQGPETDGNSV